MAEINTAAAQGHLPGVAKSKKLSTRVDLTPMVDLGFLLITFFIFTTNMSKPTAMKLIMPKGGDSMSLGESAALTVCPIAGDKVFYYHGNLQEALINHQYGFTSYSISTGIGAVIREKQAAMDKAGKKRIDLMLIIKPGDMSSYRNTVDLLDEVMINAITHYAIVDISKEDIAAVQQVGG